jgi:hypothetical protein
MPPLEAARTHLPDLLIVDQAGRAQRRRGGIGLFRRRWRSVIVRHPPKTLSYALMDRIFAWREQVVEVGDISPDGITPVSPPSPACDGTAAAQSRVITAKMADSRKFQKLAESLVVGAVPANRSPGATLPSNRQKYRRLAFRGPFFYADWRL